MRVIKEIRELQQELTKIGSFNESIGLVPTMGALHQGHLSLVERSCLENNITVATIFVNPTQFNNSDDLDCYPDCWEEDVDKLQKMGVDYLFAPSYQSLYPDGYRYRLSEDQFSRQLCGAHRPGHFDGVLTVVMKLLNIVKPHNAYFGKKDYQQYLLIKGMVEAYFLDINIIGCSTVREIDGLAMSSRNLNIKSNVREKAAIFNRELSSSLPNEEVIVRLTNAGFAVDYIEEHFSRRFGAVTLGEVRLIDNVEI